MFCQSFCAHPRNDILASWMLPISLRTLPNVPRLLDVNAKLFGTARNTQSLRHTCNATISYLFQKEQSLWFLCSQLIEHLLYWRRRRLYTQTSVVIHYAFIHEHQEHVPPLAIRMSHADICHRGAGQVRAPIQLSSVLPLSNPLKRACNNRACEQ